MIFQATDSRSSTSFPTYISRLRYNRAPHAFSLVRARTHSSPKIEIHKIYLSAYTNSQALLSNTVRYLLPATGINNACRLSNVLEQAEQELGEFFFPHNVSNGFVSGASLSWPFRWSLPSPSHDQPSSAICRFRSHTSIGSFLTAQLDCILVRTETSNVYFDTQPLPTQLAVPYVHPSL